uniref:Tyrosine-protein kinase receptor n=1 Tax=Eptatretus burgeri TaxID=7764 RepID=A0A8C4QCB3_EPTBU
MALGMRERIFVLVVLVLAWGKTLLGQNGWPKACRTRCDNFTQTTEGFWTCNKTSSLRPCIAGCTSRSLRPLTCNARCNSTFQDACEVRACRLGCSSALEDDQTPLGPRERDSEYALNATDQRKSNNELLNESTIFASKASTLLIDEATCIEKLKFGNITGISVDVQGRMVYFVDRAALWGAVVKPPDVHDIRLVWNASTELPALDVSIDWLNRQLYVLSIGTVLRCELPNCPALSTILLLNTTATTITADPYNGFLFWLSSEGIFRTDLPSHAINGNCDSAACRTDHLVHSDAVTAMAIGFESRRVLYYNYSTGSIMAMSLNGTDVQEMRSLDSIKSKGQLLDFDHLRENRLILSFSTSVMLEEWNQLTKTYYYNEVIFFCHVLGSIGGPVAYFAPTAQPVPTPTKAPDEFQAWFGIDEVLLQWSKPIDDVAESAWQNWKYEVEVMNTSLTDQVLSTSLALQHRIEGLLPGSNYIFRVRAASAAGQGPWTANFSGQTLPPKVEGEEPFIWFSSGSGLWKTALGAHNVQTLVFTNVTITDLTWSNGFLYGSLSSGRVQMWSLNESHDLPVTVPKVNLTTAIAVDWLGNRFYWGDGESYKLVRMALPSGPSEVVIDETDGPVLDLALDAVNGHMYWTSGVHLRGAFLNGWSPVNFPVQHGVNISTLTVVLDHDSLYWLTQDSASSVSIFYVKLLSSGTTVPDKPTKLQFLDGDHDGGWGLSYYSARLVWMDAKGEIVVQSLLGNASRLPTVSDGLGYRSLTLVQPTLQPLPGGYSSKPLVVPSQIPSDSVHITGTSNQFNVSWAPSIEVEYGQVYYSLVMESLDPDTQTIRTNLDEPNFEVTKKLGLLPNTLFNVTIQAFTYWAMASPTTVTLRSPTQEQSQYKLRLVAVLGVLLAVIAVCCLAISIGCRCYSNIQNSDDKPTEKISGPIVNKTPYLIDNKDVGENDKTLSHSQTIITRSKIQYQEQLQDLLHLPWDNVILLESLGSGAFGEVFSGLACRIGGQDMETHVAVKTLHSEATDEEKVEFLKEAYTMSFFDHSNILRLLAVCLDHEPQCILLELMEGGDLLMYLREARSTQSHGVLLSMADLMQICLEVACGCSYLERLHFVHRDLASRNCLVSTPGYNPDSNRVVKIGDFGLARDIYRFDYYRKGGEGLLPVRWMAPESLQDGIFTIRSDVWAFGVLLWEIMSLGQQPYPARTNIEVLKFVVADGRLECPSNCPDAIYKLMASCWRTGADERPSFSFLLEELQTLVLSQLVLSEDNCIDSITYADFSDLPGNAITCQGVYSTSNDRFAMTYLPGKRDDDPGASGFQRWVCIPPHPVIYLFIPLMRL